MESTKSRVFNYLSKSQKSGICHYLGLFSKKHQDKDLDTIFSLFLEEEQYYLELNNSRHPWIGEFLDDESFHRDIKLYIKDQLKKIEYKERQKPFIEAQKKLAKEQRVKAQEFKMSKEPPTKAQMSYYKSLCKKYGIAPSINEAENSKLEFRNEIDAILSKYSDKDSTIAKLSGIISAREMNK